MTQRLHPQIKICGLTDPDQARACAELGADAIGLVFFTKSPRNVTVEQAAAITAALPDHAASVGVFVNYDLDDLVEIIRQCGLSAVQLHGTESNDYVSDLYRATGVGIIKALFTEKSPGLSDCGRYKVNGYLVECGKGRLPGGNAVTWNWAAAAQFAQRHPLILAGGLAPHNVAKAIADCLPDAVDASSGLEAAPGRKDIEKVKQFIDQVRQTGPLYADRGRALASILQSSYP